jgi:hypothetical protein
VRGGACSHYRSCPQLRTTTKGVNPQLCLGDTERLVHHRGGSEGAVLKANFYFSNFCIKAVEPTVKAINFDR